MEEERRDPAQIIRWPAVGLLFVGITSLLFTVFGMLFGGELNAWVEEAVREQYGEEAVFGFDPVYEQISNAVGLVMSILVVIGGAMMLNRKSWAMSLVASILVMIPCVGPCCGLFLPIGVWSIVVLMKPEVKQAMS